VLCKISLEYRNDRSLQRLLAMGRFAYVLDVIARD
jgi:hypothetical protein